MANICPECFGSGYVCSEVLAGYSPEFGEYVADWVEETCPLCEGTGWYDLEEEECSLCSGTGCVYRLRPQEVLSPTG